MINSLYIHIGLHKTGTSSIQKFLKLNENKLIEKDILYYTPSKWPLKETDDLCNYGLDVNGFNSLKNVDVDKVIISHENYSWLDDSKKIEKLYDKLSKYANKVYAIIYIRRQDVLAVSQKQEGTKWSDNSKAYGHEIKAFPEKLTIAAQKYLNFEEKIEMWNSAFNGNLKVRIFEKNKFYKKDLIQDFLYSVGIESSDDFVFPARVNESLSLSKQLFLHTIRPYFPEYSNRKHLITKIVTQDISLTNEHDKLLPSKKEALHFYSQFKESNIRLNKKLNLTNEDDIFENDFNQFPDETNFIELTKNEIIENFSIVFEHITPRLEVISDNFKVLESKVDLLRDSAIKLENTDINQALKLMRLALALRPNGVFISNKVKEYLKRIESEI